MVFGKSKGNKYELLIYKDLRDIVPDLKRTIGSGSSESDADLISDIHGIIIECKHHKVLKEGILTRFWNKVLDESAKIDKLPALVYKENNQPIKVRILNDFGDYTLPVDISYEAFKILLMEGWFRDW